MCVCVFVCVHECVHVSVRLWYCVAAVIRAGTLPNALCIISAESFNELAADSPADFQEGG